LEDDDDDDYIVIQFNLMFFDVLTRESDDQLQSASAQNIIQKQLEERQEKGIKQN